MSIDDDRMKSIKIILDLSEDDKKCLFQLSPKEQSFAIQTAQKLEKLSNLIWGVGGDISSQKLFDMPLGYILRTCICNGINVNFAIDDKKLYEMSKK